jgi:hypothetical protein
VGFVTGNVRVCPATYDEVEYIRNYLPYNRQTMPRWPPRLHSQRMFTLLLAGPLVRIPNRFALALSPTNLLHFAFPTSLALLSVPGPGTGFLLFSISARYQRGAARQKNSLLGTTAPLRAAPDVPESDAARFDPPLLPGWSLNAIENKKPHLAAHTEDEMIKIGNKKHGTSGIYVGRPSPLGNPFPLHREEERAAVIRAYEDWLAEQLLDPSSPASREIHRLAELARKQDLCLVCWCAPKACHGDIIKRTIEAINRK